MGDRTVLGIDKRTALEQENVGHKVGSHRQAVNILRGTVKSVAFMGKLLDYVIDVDSRELQVQDLAGELRKAGEVVDLHCRRNVMSYLPQRFAYPTTLDL